MVNVSTADYAVSLSRLKKNKKKPPLLILIVNLQQVVKFQVELILEKTEKIK